MLCVLESMLTSNQLSLPQLLFDFKEFFMSQNDTLLEILCSLTSQGTISRRQQLYLSVSAAAGRIDQLFTGCCVPPWHFSGGPNEGVIAEQIMPFGGVNLIHSTDRQRIQQAATALPKIASKAAETLSELLASAVSSSVHSAASDSEEASVIRSRLQLVDYLYPMVASLLGVTLEPPPPSTSIQHNNSSGGSKCSNIADVIFRESPTRYFGLVQQFKSVFLALLNVSNGVASQNGTQQQQQRPSSTNGASPYTIEIDKGTCSNGQLVMAASILVKLVLCPLLVSRSSGHLSKEYEQLSATATKLLGPNTSCKLSAIFCSFLLAGGPRVATKLEGESPLLTTMKRVELSDLYAAAALCASNTLQLLHASPVTRKSLSEALRNGFAPSGAAKASRRAPLCETQDYQINNGRLSSVAAEDDCRDGATLSRTLDVRSDPSLQSEAAFNRLLGGASAGSLTALTLLRPLIGPPVDASGAVARDSSQPHPSTLTHNSIAALSQSVLHGLLSSDVMAFLSRCEAMSNDLELEASNRDCNSAGNVSHSAKNGSESQQELIATTVAAKCLYLSSEQAFFASKTSAAIEHLLWCQLSIVKILRDGAAEGVDVESPNKQRKTATARGSQVSALEHELLSLSGGVVTHVVSVLEACAIHIPSPAMALTTQGDGAGIANAPIMSELKSMHILSPQGMLSASLLPHYAARALAVHAEVLACLSTPRQSRGSVGSAGATAAEMEDDQQSQGTAMLLMAAVSAGFDLREKGRYPQRDSQQITSKNSLKADDNFVKILDSVCGSKCLSASSMSKLLQAKWAPAYHRFAILSLVVFASQMSNSGSVDAQAWLRQQLTNVGLNTVAPTADSYFGKLRVSFVANLLLGNTSCCERLHDLIVRGCARLTIPPSMADYDGPLHEVGFLTQSGGTTPVRGNHTSSTTAYAFTTTTGYNSRFSGGEDGGEVYFNGLPNGRPSDRLSYGDSSNSHPSGPMHTSPFPVNQAAVPPFVPSTTNYAGTIHDYVNGLQQLLGGLQSHASDHDNAIRELQHLKSLAAQQEGEIRRLKKVHNQEVAAFQNDAKALNEKIRRIKSESLDEAARHASELTRANKIIEERDNTIEDLRQEKSALTTKLRRQETRTQQILGMLQQTDSQEH